MFLSKTLFFSLLSKLVQPTQHPNMTELEDLKVLKRSPDLLNNVKIGQGQLWLIMKHILFYHIWGLWPLWSSDPKTI